MQEKVRQMPVGGMNKDFDYLHFSEGDYLHAENIHHNTDGGNTTLSCEYAKGTDLKFSLPLVGTGNTAFRMYMKKPEEASTGEQMYEFAFTVHDSWVSYMHNFFVDPFPNEYPTPQQVKDAFDSYNDDTTIVGLISVGDLKSNNYDRYYFDLYFDTQEYEVSIPPSSAYTIPSRDQHVNHSVLKVEEWIPTAYRGGLVPIGSASIMGDLYIFSAHEGIENDPGIGEIGVWDGEQYITLLRSMELKFSQKHPILDVHIEKEEGRVSIYFTDFYNNYRVFYTDREYDLRYVDSEMQIFKQDLGDLSLEFDTQDQQGGNLPHGVWKYFVRLYNERGTPSQIMESHNLIPVYHGLEDSTSLPLVLGEDNTGKINRLTVSGIETRNYSFVELIAVRYLSLGFEAFSLGRQDITGSTMEMSHTGNERGILNLDVSVFFRQNAPISRGKTITGIDNRLLYGNVVLKEGEDRDDLHELAEGITIEQTTSSFKPVGKLNEQPGEYQIIDNYVKKRTWMPFETYRFAVQFTFSSGNVSSWYDIDDIEVGFEFPDKFVGAGYASDFHFPKIRFSNLFNGPLWDGIEKVRFGYANYDNEVLFTGNVMPLKDYGLLFPESYMDPISPGRDQVDGYYICIFGPDLHVHDFSFLPGDNLVIPKSDNRNIYPAEHYDQAGSIGRNGVFYHSYTPSTTDAGDADWYSVLEAEKFTRHNDQIKTIGTARVSNHDLVSRYNDFIVLKLNRPVSGIMEKGHGFYIRRKEDNIKDTYTPITPWIDDVSVEDTGGDTFMNTAIYDHVFNTREEHPITPDIPIVSKSVIVFPNYTRYPSQYKIGKEGEEEFPFMSSQNFEDYIRTKDYELSSQFYARRYSVRDEIVINGRKEEEGGETHYETRLYYSELKTSGSGRDFYRTVLPLNFKDFDRSKGEITNVSNANGRLFIHQTYSFLQQPFNTRGLIPSEEGEEIIVGSGDVMSHSERILSSFGCSHHFGVVIGKSMRGGKDVIYWIDSKNGRFVRFGHDGTLSLSDKDRMQWFFNKGLKFVDGKDNILTGMGVNGYFDIVNREVVFIVNGQREDVQHFIQNQTYSEGEVVFLNYEMERSIEDITPTFEGTGQFAKLLRDYEGDHNYSDLFDPIDKYNLNYYNTYCIAYNEVKNRFTTFYTFKPRLPMVNDTEIYSPRTTPTDRDRIYELYAGSSHGKYYELNGEYQEGKFVVEMVINMHPDLLKYWYGLFCNAYRIPDEVRFYTENHETFSHPNDWESGGIIERGGNFFTDIKNDVTETGDPDVGGDRLHGNYLIVKFVTNPSEYQKLFSVVSNLRRAFRTPEN